jgi:hypothetical protein
LAKKLPKLTSADPRLNSLLRWAQPSFVRAKPAYKLTARPPSDPTFRPLASTPQHIADKIWGRILFFAMLALEPRPKTVVLKKHNERQATPKRLRFLLVSKLFHVGYDKLLPECGLTQPSASRTSVLVSLPRRSEPLSPQAR